MVAELDFIDSGDLEGAIDADTGTVLWEYVPPGIAGWEDSAQLTTAAPAADPGRRFLYAASPDGPAADVAPPSSRRGNRCNVIAELPAGRAEVP